jgi:hypothetical protein
LAAKASGSEFVATDYTVVSAEDRTCSGAGRCGWGGHCRVGVEVALTIAQRGFGGLAGDLVFGFVARLALAHGRIARGKNCDGR